MPVPKPAPRASYGTVKLKFVVSMFDKSIPETKTIVSKKPLTFEELRQNYGYVLYQTKMPLDLPDPSVLDVPNLRDRAVVYLNQVSFSLELRSEVPNWLLFAFSHIYLRIVNTRNRRKERDRKSL